MTNINRTGAIARSAVVSVSYLALCLAGTPGAQAQSASGSSLPAVTVTAPEAGRRTNPSSVSRTSSSARRRRTQTARRPETAPEPKPFAPSQDAVLAQSAILEQHVGGDQGQHAAGQHSAVGQRRHQGIHQGSSFQSLTDVTRYVPGVAVHQGEGNRDELVIRGVDSSANFFVNGFRETCNISATSTTPKASRS